MKPLLVVVVSLAVALAAPPTSFEVSEDEDPAPLEVSEDEVSPPLGGYNYHELFGFELTARIKASEEAADFDGARIVGGSPVQALGQYPFMAGLVIQMANGRQSSCGATLVSNTRCLTAAHCWLDGRTPARQLIVVLGSLRLFSGGTRISTSRVTPHTGWNPGTLANDIAMIRIRRVSFSNAINRINLPTGAATFVGTTANAVGWGFTSQNSGVSEILRHVSMPVVTNEVCARAHGATFIHASTICTSTAGGRGTCFGDSGGPLHVAAGNILIGVTSFVHRSGCQGGQPAGFTRVTSHMTWIRQQM